MSSNFERNKQVEARNAKSAEKIEQLKRWLELSHPDIHTGIGTQKAFLEDMGDSFLTATSDDFEYSLRTMTTTLSRHRVPSEAETKAALIDKICSMIASTNGGRDGKYDEVNLKSERIKMSHFSISQLTKRLDEIVRKQSLASKSASELKQIISDARHDGRPYPGFQTLDPAIQASHIKALSSAELRKLIRLHSVEQVNARLAGRS